MDESEHLWGDVVTPERAAKGDLDLTRHEHTGHIRHAQVRDTTLLAHLIRRGILDDHHGYYAMVFADLNRQFLRRVDFKGNTIYAAEFFSTNSDGFLETLYLRVCRSLGKRYERAVKSACYTVTSPTTLRNLPCPVSEYRLAFDALVHSIDQERKNSCKSK